MTYPLARRSSCVALCPPGQFEDRKTVTADDIRDVWQSLCLLRQALDDLLLAGGFDEEQIDWLQFLALAAGTLEKVG